MIGTVPGLATEHDLLVQLLHVVPKLSQEPPTRGGDPEHLTRAHVGRARAPTQPPVLLHTRERRVEGPRAKDMAVLRQLVEEPQPPHVAAGGVVEDVNLPDAEADLAIGGRQHYENRYTPPWPIVKLDAFDAPPVAAELLGVARLDKRIRDQFLAAEWISFSPPVSHGDGPVATDGRTSDGGAG